MLNCAMCDRPLRECCDIYHEVVDSMTDEEFVICGDCAAQLGIAEAEYLKGTGKGNSYES